MANVLNNPSLLAKRALMVLENQLTFTKNANTEYSDQFAKQGAKIGDTINVRKPPRFMGRDGQALAVEGVSESFVPVKITAQAGCDISISLVDETLSLDNIEERLLKPMMATVANKIDLAGTALFMDINRIVNLGGGYGTPGGLNAGTATSAQVSNQVLTAGAILTESGVPNDGSRCIVMDPQSRVNAATPMTTMFNPNTKISSVFEKGYVGNGVLGFDWGEDANIRSFTPSAAGGLLNGTSTGTLTSSGATTIAVASVTAGTVPRGTIFSLAGVYAINPQSRLSTGRLMQFVVTADTVVTTTGTLPIYPAYIPSGQFATCVGSGSAAAVVQYTGATGTGPFSQNIAYHKNAFTLATADMMLPKGVHIAERVTHNGITMSMISQYDISSNQMPLRFDVLFGWTTIYPDLAVRIGG